MNREYLINELTKNISLYKNFICPDYPDLNIFTDQYLDILVQSFNASKNPYSIIFSDVNKLSVVNERYGKNIGDKTLYTLLRLFIKTPAFNNCPTVRIGGDEFITFVANSSKQDVEKALKIASINFERQKDYLYGSSMAFGVADSSSGTAKELIKIAEQKVNEQKNKNRDKDIFFKQASNSGQFIDLSIPEEIDENQKEKWKNLNKKINMLIDNHLRDIRPSNIRFQYKPEHIRKDLKSFGTAFLDLFYNAVYNKKELINTDKEDKNDTNFASNSHVSCKSASIIHSLFNNEDVNLNDLTDEELIDIKSSLDKLSKNLIRNKHSGLLGKSYYKIFLADKLLKAKQSYQAIYFSASGIRPSNTAYGHTHTDEKIAKTSDLLVKTFSKYRIFNNEPFTFNNTDTFLIDQNGGNFIALIPNKQRLTFKEIDEIVNEINSHCTNDKNCTLKIASATKNNVNRIMIPFFINSMPGNQSNFLEWLRTIKLVIKNRTKHTYLLGEPRIYSDICNKKPFVQLARRLKEDCNNNKDPIKEENLDKLISSDSIKAIAKDCISYYYNEIDDPSSLDNRKLFIDNVILALANHESYVNSVNQKTLQKKLDDRSLFKNVPKEIEGR